MVMMLQYCSVLTNMVLWLNNWRGLGHTLCHTQSLPLPLIRVVPILVLGGICSTVVARWTTS